MFVMFVSLSAGLLRQATYTTSRMGIYQSLLDWASNDNKKPIGFAEKACIGIFSGGVSAYIGTPAEVAAWMPGAMAVFTFCLHTTSTHQVRFTGPDSADGRVHVFNRNGVDWQGHAELFDVGAVYDDAYVRATMGHAATQWGDYMRGDDGAASFPFVRRRGGVVLVGVGCDHQADARNLGGQRQQPLRGRIDGRCGRRRRAA